MNTESSLAEFTKPVKAEITIEELKRMRGYENMSHDEANQAIDSIKELCLLIYHAQIQPVK